MIMAGDRIRAGVFRRVPVFAVLSFFSRRLAKTNYTDLEGKEEIISEQKKMKHPDRTYR